MIDFLKKDIKTITKEAAFSSGLFSFLLNWIL